MIVLTPQLDITRRQSRIAVLFVHGLFGSPFGKESTWDGMYGLVLEKFPSVDAALVKFDTGITRWQWSIFTQSDFGTESRKIKSDIEELTRNYSAVIICAHSMGGLLAQNAICELAGDAQKKVLALIAFAVPFFGSAKVPWVSRLFSPEARVLAAFSPYANETSAKFNKQFKCEYTSRIRQKGRIALKGLWGSRDPWVAEQSARGYMSNEHFKIVGGDHNDVCKPVKHGGEVFETLCGWLSEIEKLVYESRVIARNTDWVLRPIEANESSAVNQLGENFFGADTSGDEHTSQWIKRNRHVIYLLISKKSGRPNGFWSVLPIAQSRFDHLKAGKSVARDFTATDVLLPHEESGHYYVGAIAAEGRVAKAVLIEGMFEWFRQRKLSSQHGIFRVLARAATADGFRLIRKSQFRHVHGPEGVGGLFEGML